MTSPFLSIAADFDKFAREDLRCMFFHGPTRDGNLPSKSGRDWLVEKGFADRAYGWNWLTADGTKLAIEIGLDREKDIWQRRPEVKT